MTTKTELPAAQHALFREICKAQSLSRSFRFSGYFPPIGRKNGPAIGALVRRGLIFKSMRGGYKPTTLGWENRSCL